MTAFLVPQDDSGRIVTFDVIESESYETTSQITDHPVEVGINITDHVRKLPDRVSIIGYVSNQPIIENPFTKRGVFETRKIEAPQYSIPLEPTPGSLYRNLISAIDGALFGAQSRNATLLAFSEPFNAIAETYETLLDLQAGGVFVEVVTPLVGSMPEMVIERVAAPRTAGDSGVAFSIDLRQLRVVESGQVAAPPVPKDNVPGGKPLVNKGAQGAKKPKPGEDPKKAGSLAYQAAKSLGVL